ncbi:hypothetical protein AGMMS50239_24110 [Bacteroidia bacterium]|nr:hypothetical protein AGMMS50239_24110 [Bacteroidia bacterium]
MKRIYSILFILCLSLGTVFAQTPSNRTANTIIADVLAQLPANNQANYNQKMKDLVSTGEAGILQLAKSLETNKGNDAKVKYALNGLATYVSAEGQDAARLTVVNAYLKALDEIKDADNKAFIISLLEIAGKEEAIAKLKTYSKDAATVVSNAATKALTSINGPEPQRPPFTEKQTRDLFKKAEKEGKIQNREAWLQRLMASNPANVVKLVRTALKDESRDYRNAALNYARDYPSSELFVELSNTMKKASPELKTDILNWFARIYGGNELTIVPFYSNLALPELANKDLEVRKAAITLMAKIDNNESMQALAKLLNSSDEQNIQLAKEALIVKKGNISDEVAAVIPTATESGIIAGLELLAHRKADKHLNVVLSYLNSTNPKLQTAAYTALKDVATPESLPALSAQLQLAPANAVSAVQQAIVAAIRSYPADKKLEIITQNMNLAAANNKQYLFYPLLATTGDPKALNTIIERFSKESGTAKEAAFQALLDWNGIEVADELYKIGQSTSTFSAKATDSYIKLASDTKLSGENRRIFLTNALEIAKTDAQKNEILKQLGQTNSYLGLLLAGEYLDKPAVQQAAANAVRDIALNNKNFTGKNIRQLLEKVSKVLDNPDAGYQREAIRKHLNEMPDEEGFVSIFNGKDLTHWKGLVGNPLVRAKMKPAELAKAQVKANEQMRKDWKVENGLLVFDGTGYDNICTEKLYGDFEMYVDWQLEPSPEADAGIYLRGTPQVQMWNIERTNVGAQVGSGGLYNNQTNPSKPLKVADNKLGEWNNLYIKMIGDRVTVLLNGELVVDQVILENYWDRSQAIFPVEQIELQAHGSKVYYKNIYVKELERPKPFELSAQEKKEGFQMLFDGTNMHEWTGNLADYLLEEGTISVHPGQSYGGNLYTKKEYADFAFRFEFQLTPSANNGVGIRSSMKGDDAYNAMEIQILDCEHPVYKDIEPYQHHGSVYGVIAAEHGAMKPVGEWNEEEIYAKGDHIRVTLNGKVILDGNIREAAKNGTIDHKEHPGLFNKTGHIGFLGHGNELKFRNIRIKEIK